MPDQPQHHNPEDERSPSQITTSEAGDHAESDAHTEQQGQAGAADRRFWGALALLFALSIGLGAGVALWRSASNTPEQPKVTQAHDVGAPLRAGLIRGKVRSSGGLALKNATVRLEPLGRHLPSYAKAHELQSDLDGAFQFPPVPYLGHKLTIQADGHLDEVIERLMPGGDPLLIDMTPARGLRGRVTLGGVGVEGAQVKIGGPGLWPQRTVVTDDQGLFTATAVPNGDLEILARHEALNGASYGALLPIEHRDEAGAALIDIPLAPAVTLNLRVEDARSAQPLPGARVTLARDIVDVLSLSAWANDQGEVEFFGLPPRDYVLSISAPGHLQVHPRISLNLSLRRRLLTAALPRAATISGTVTNTAGVPLELARVTAHVTTQRGQQWVIQRDPTFSGTAFDASPNGFFAFFTDHEGRFTVVGLPPGQVILEVRLQDHQRLFAGPYTLSKGSDLDGVALIMSPGHSVRGRVTGPNGEPLAMARVRISPAQPPPMAAGALPGMAALRQRLLLTDEDGAFEASGLPAQILIQASTPDLEPASQTVALSPEETREVELSLGKIGEQIEGRVLLAGELPLPGVRLWHQPPPGAPTRSPELCMTLSDEAGRFALSGCPEGPFWAELIPDEASGAARTWTQLTPGPAVELNVVRAASLALTTQTPDAAPLSDVQVTLSPRDPLKNMPRWLRQRHDQKRRTNSDGLATFEQLPPGDYVLTFRGEGLRDHQETLTLIAPVSLKADPDEPDEPTRHTVALEPARSLRGGVADRYGAPVPDASVRLVASGHKTVRARTDARGRFTATIPHDDELKVIALHPLIGRAERTAPASLPIGSELILELLDPVIDLEIWREPMSQLGATLWEDGDRVVLESVEDDSPVARAGLRRGDVVVTLEEARAAPDGKGGPKGVLAEVQREGRQLTLTITP